MIGGFVVIAMTIECAMQNVSQFPCQKLYKHKM